MRDTSWSDVFIAVTMQGAAPIFWRGTPAEGRAVVVVGSKNVFGLTQD